jgi:hypothetical protein
MMKLYPCGYSAHSEQIRRLMDEQPGLLLIDARYTAWSAWVEWRQDALSHLYGARYVGAGRVLGNVNHDRASSPIALANAEAGIHVLRSWLEQTDVLLLCGCAQYEACHLKVIVGLLLAEVPEVEVIFPEALAKIPATPALEQGALW